MIRSLRRAALVAASAMGLAAYLGAGLAGAAPATGHPAAAQSVQFWTHGGNNLALGCGAGACGAGNMITQVAMPGKQFTFSNDITFNGDPAGTMQLPNGNFMAANSTCSGVTIKSSSSSDGTVWADHPNGATDWLVNRFCSGGDIIIIYSDNVSGHQWKFCDPGPIDVTCGTGKFWNLDFNKIG